MVGGRLNDIGRFPVRCEDEERLAFLEQMQHAISQVSGGQGGKRAQSLTSSCRNAFRLTLLLGHLSLKKVLHLQVCHNVLLWRFQTDQLEDEFGIYRQLNGGNYMYCIGFEQILRSASFIDFLWTDY